MSEPEQLAKATLQMIQWDGDIATEKDPTGSPTKAFPVQFNPQTLKVSFSTQKAGGDQTKGSGVQFVGRGSTKLSLELWYDTTVTDTQGSNTPNDVRKQTEEVNKLMQAQRAKPGKDTNTFFPPGVRFQWGSFLFDGVMDSMDETLEYFSSTGVPLRASVSLSISRQEMKFGRQDNAAAELPGTSMLASAKAGEPLAKVTTNPNAVAAANGQENARTVPTGTMLNLSPNALPSASLGIGASIGGSFGVSANLSFGASASGSFSGSGGGSVLGGISASARSGIDASGRVSGSSSGVAPLGVRLR